MKLSRLCAVSAFLGLTSLWIVNSSAQEVPASPEGVEVLARGPVHEAFAEPVDTQPQPGAIVKKQPPEAIEEVPPDQKPEGDNVQWIPGYWAWDDDSTDYIWVSGFWRVPPPERRWIPGHWQQVDTGWMWIAGFWALANLQEVQYLPAPPPAVDEGPSTPAPNETSTYVPGCWMYETNRYMWRPGHWIAYQPNWLWISSHYIWTPSGCLFVPGYWDHPLEARGLLFAPIRFARAWLVGPRRRFVPSFVVNHDFMIGSLFVAAAAHHYYFGDYFEDRYVKRGFVPWPEYRLGKGAYDPNFNYYRHLHAAEPHWETGIRDLYHGRLTGEVARPPHTLLAQTEAIKNIRVNKTENIVVHKNINITNVQNINVLSPLKEVHNVRVTNLGSLSQVKESKIVNQVHKLEPVKQEEIIQHQKAAEVIRESSQIRRESEAKLMQQGGVPLHHTDPPKAVKLELPKPPPPIVVRPAVKVPPPAPVVPKHIEQAIPKYEPRKLPGPPPKK